MLLEILTRFILVIFIIFIFTMPYTLATPAGRGKRALFLFRLLSPPLFGRKGPPDRPRPAPRSDEATRTVSDSCRPLIYWRCDAAWICPAFTGPASLGPASPRAV